jgi:SAM-dependent methyltransferase
MIDCLQRMIRSGFRRVRQLVLPIPRPDIPHGPDGVSLTGHRYYVGGLWNEMGRLQFEFLKSQGLKPEHVLLDIACGSLRAGVHLIPYLDAGHYLGIDKEASLIDAGLKKELGHSIAERKRPQFVVSANFDFAAFDKCPDIAIAQSLFTHLPPALIDDCFRKLRTCIRPGGRFFATYFEHDSDAPAANPEQPHDHHSFHYHRREIEAFGERNGWRTQYIGDWSHPRGQVIVCYHAD